MRKDDAIQLLGGTIQAAATRIGCTYEAVRKWPDPLPARLRDRVQAALWREDSSVEDLLAAAEDLRRVALRRARTRDRGSAEPAAAALGKP